MPFKALVKFILITLLVVLGTLAISSENTYAEEGASLLFHPNTGEYFVGGTFDVSIVLDTKNQYINTVRADIKFPQDKIQIVNPSASTSFVKIWVTPPSYSNTDGILSFQGGIPTPGINTSKGIVSTITFRAIAPGPVNLEFGSPSQVLLADGQGTNILTTKGNTQFVLKISPPEGPETFSTTHEDPSKWYQNRNIGFSWKAISNAEGYSYALDQIVLTLPDETIDTTDTNAMVTAANDGEWYFHIRAKTVSWGEATHISVKIDTTPPAEFAPSVEIGGPADEARSVAKFLTTDSNSGIDHYEVRLFSPQIREEDTPFFTEQNSPYLLPNLEPGKHELVVRAIDKAGNHRDGKLVFNIEATAPPMHKPLFLTNVYTNIALIVIFLVALFFIIRFIWRKTHPRKAILSDITELEKDIAKKEQKLTDEIKEEKEIEEKIEEEISETNHKEINNPK